jgi:tetratricopeptide (TPR) repeat protein
MPTEKQLEKAAAPTRDRLVRDLDRVSERVKPIVRAIDRNLFSPSFQVSTLLPKLGIRDHSAVIWFSKEFEGVGPWAYACDCRLEIGGRLLKQTSLKVFRIAIATCYSPHNFSRAFKKWSGSGGLTPTEYQLNPTSGETPQATQEDQECHRIDPYPQVCGVQQETPREIGTPLTWPLRPLIDTEAIERFDAAELWPRLTKLTFSEQREVVQSWTFWTPGPFKFFHQKAREEGRRDKKRGRQVAQLTLDCLDGNEDRLVRVHELWVEGWSWLANAQRLDLDFSESEASFREAEGILDTHDLSDAWVAGVFYFLKGTLRMFERKHDKALALFDRALPPFKNAGDVHFQVRTLLHRTTALSYADLLEQIEPTLDRATILLQEAPDEELSFKIAYAMTNALVRTGHFGRAETKLISLADQIAGIGVPVWRNQIRWRQAMIDHGLGRLRAAETKYLNAWRGFQALNEPRLEALVALDLSLLYSELGEIARVLEFAPMVCQFFEVIGLYDETLTALQLLSDTIFKAEITTDLLSHLRSLLRSDPVAVST